MVVGVTALVMAGCSSDSKSDPPPTAAATTVERPSPDAGVSAQDAGLPLGSAKLSSEQAARAEAFTTQWGQQLVAQHPELAGLSAPEITPVYEERSAGPIGARAVYRVPQVVPEIQLDLVRLHESGPETMPSTIDNLRALEMIYLFDGDKVVHVGIVADPTDATDPAGAAVVHPVDPEQHRDAAFGGNE